MPATESVRERILQHVVTTLQGVTREAGYRQTILRVTRESDTPGTAQGVFPCAIVLDPAEDYVPVTADLWQGLMTYTVELWVQAGGTTHSTTLSQIIMDVILAMTGTRDSYQRGGIAAETKPLSSVSYPADDAQAVSVAHVTFQTLYRFRRTNPTAAL